MTTYGSDPSPWKFTVGLIIALLLIMGAFLSANQGGNIRQHEHDVAPCSSFSQDTLSELPARCVTPEGGFKQ